ncbi:IS256 family transposase, partial [Micromonospora fulviviridis]
MTDDQLAGPLGSAVAGPGGAARDTVNGMIEAGLLDDLMDRVDAGGLALTG